jgi:predicted ATPase
VIESIEIKNLRGIHEGKLEGLTALTILVGPNGCGKGTILDALLIVSMPKAVGAEGMFGAGGGQDPVARAIKVVVERHGRLKEWQRWFYWRADARAQCSLRAR